MIAELVLVMASALLAPTRDDASTQQGTGDVTIACDIPARVEQFSSFWVEFRIHNGRPTGVAVQMGDGVNVLVRSGDDWQELETLNKNGVLRDLRPSGQTPGAGDEEMVSVPAHETVVVAREYRDPYGITFEGDFRLMGMCWLVEANPGQPQPKRTAVASSWATYSVVKGPSSSALAESRREDGALWRAYRQVMRWNIDWSNLTFPNFGATRAIADALDQSDPAIAAATALDSADVPAAVRMRARMLKCKIAAERALNASAAAKPAAFGAVAGDLETLLALAEQVNRNWVAEIHFARCLCHEQSGSSTELAAAKTALAQEPVRSIVRVTHSRSAARLLP